MTFSLQFPLWRYLNQSLFDPTCSPILNPRRYWRLYAVHHLECCLSANWVEQCWRLDYYQFVEQSQGFIDGHYLEEDNIALIEQCWYLTRTRRHDRS